MAKLPIQRSEEFEGSNGKNDLPLTIPSIFSRWVVILARMVTLDLDRVSTPKMKKEREVFG